MIFRRRISFAILSLLVAQPTWPETYVGGVKVSPPQTGQSYRPKPARKVRPDQYDCVRDPNSTKDSVVNVALDSQETFLQTIVRKKNGSIRQIEGVISDHAVLNRIESENDFTLNAWTYFTQYVHSFKDFYRQHQMEAPKMSQTGLYFGEGKIVTGGGHHPGNSPPGGWGGNVWGQVATSISTPLNLGRPGDLAMSVQRQGDKAPQKAGEAAGAQIIQTDSPRPDIPERAGVSAGNNEIYIPERAPIERSKGSQIPVRGSLKDPNLGKLEPLKGQDPGLRAGDQVAAKPGSIVAQPGIVAFTALLDDNGNLVQVFYRDGRSTPKDIRIGPQQGTSFDPVVEKIKASLAKIKTYAACCSNDSKAQCDTKYAPPLLVDPSGVKNAQKPGEVIISPFTGKPFGPKGAK